MISKKSRTIGRSFRISEQWLNLLSVDAENEGISLNAFVNRLFKDYCEFYRFWKRYPFIILTKNGFSDMLKAIPEEKLKIIAEKAGTTILDDLFRTAGFSFNRERVTLLITRYHPHYGNWYTCDHYIKANKEVFHLRHTLGENWSIYVSKIISTLFEGLDKKVRTTLSEGSVTIEVPM